MTFASYKMQENVSDSVKLLRTECSLATVT
jgi:hypothetical protein